MVHGLKYQMLQLMLQHVLAAHTTDVLSATKAAFGGLPRVASGFLAKAVSGGFPWIISNLHKLDIDLPLGLFVCLTGVSGSGKSTLAQDVIHLNLARQLGREVQDEPARIRELKGAERINDVLLVDQSPLARTPRSIQYSPSAFSVSMLIVGDNRSARSRTYR